jgi:hypothetical protein
MTNDSGSHETITVPGLENLREDRGPATHRPGDLNTQLIETSVWNDGMVAAAGIPIIDIPFVTVGGGMGSFVMADYLRIAGVPPNSIRVLGATEVPWETYSYLTGVSQIPLEERLRSDSSGCPDNIWAFPSYAVREAFGERRPTKFLAPLWNVFVEPVFTDYFTPKSGQVFRGLRKEADRIGWSGMVEKGLVRMVRKREGGGYFTILTPPEGKYSTKRVAYRSAYVHVAVGYPGLRYLPDLQEYRQRYQDYVRVVNAYEPHDHVYDELQRHPGTVVLRGGGIVASRVLQRLTDDHDQKGSRVHIDHLFRTYVTGSHGPSIFMRRKGGDGWSYQGFNWPKSGWGGQLKARLERTQGEERQRLLGLMGGTTTPKRKLWQQQLRRGRNEGWYRTIVGEVAEVMPGDNGTVVTRIKTAQGLLELPANFVIDATGLEADIREHRLLADLLDHSGVQRNVLGKLDVDLNFELTGTRNGPGRMYAVGSSTLGCGYSVVDSFLGLQYAGLTVADDLARLGFCQRIGVGRSITQWWRWVLNRKV